MYIYIQNMFTPTKRIPGNSVCVCAFLFVLRKLDVHW